MAAADFPEQQNQQNQPGKTDHDVFKFLEQSRYFVEQDSQHSDEFFEFIHSRAGDF